MCLKDVLVLATSQMWTKFFLRFHPTEEAFPTLLVPDFWSTFESAFAAGVSVGLEVLASAWRIGNSQLELVTGWFRNWFCIHVPQSFLVDLYLFRFF